MFTHTQNHLSIYSYKGKIFKVSYFRSREVKKMAVHNERVILHGIEGEFDKILKNIKIIEKRGNCTTGQFLPVATLAARSRDLSLVETRQRGHFQEASPSRLE